MMTNEMRVEKLEFTACGPRARLSRRGVLDLVLLFAATLALALFAKWGLRGGRFGVAPLSWWTGAGVAGAVVTALFVRIFRRGEDWALYLGATLVASLLTSLSNFAGASPAGTAMALLPLAPAALVILAFVRMVRRADELQRHILHRALAFAFTVGVGASMAWGILEAAGLPRLPAVAWCSMLVIAFALGIAIFARRYQ
jgi:hypothetical protein